MENPNSQRQGWWRHRTRLEKLYLILTPIIILLIIGLIVGLILLSTNTKKSTGVFAEEICNTKGCVKIASQFLNNINNSVDPCDDFYQFACGNFIQNTRIPDDKTKVNSFSMLDDQVYLQLRNILEEKPKKGDPISFSLTKRFFNTCMDEFHIEKEQLVPFKKVLKELGGWPVLEGDNWEFKKLDWKIVTAKLKQNGFSFSHVLPLDVSVDSKNTSQYILEISQARLNLPRSYLLKNISDEILKAYYNYMINVAVIFDANNRYAAKEFTKVLEFERNLAEISVPSEELRNGTKTYNPMTIAELQKKYPSINWLKYINSILAPSLQVTSDEIIIIAVPEYIKKLEVLLENTPQRTIVNLMIWGAVQESIVALPQELKREKLAFKAAILGVTQETPRWRQCVDITYGSYILTTSSMYIRKYFDSVSKQKALALTQDIRDIFIEILKTVDWMDEDTRHKALDKANAIETHIGYPDELLDNQKLDDFYKNVTVGNEFLENILKFNIFTTEFSFSLLFNPVNKSVWYLHSFSATVNAFYNVNENSINFPAAILQDVFFGSDRPNYINYGAIGFIIGHEITHGFDDQGRQYNKNGMLENWWSKKTEKSFLNKTQCIIDEYSNFKIPEINESINGIKTQGENIADNGGLKEAYIAYKNWMSKQSNPEPKLPGLPYTPTQMFWLSSANIWCTVERPDALKMSIASDVHSPGQFRVIGTLSNLKEFADDFNCPVGSKMNPKNKCEVW